jgi:hypothetical protein
MEAVTGSNEYSDPYVKEVGAMDKLYFVMIEYILDADMTNAGRFIYGQVDALLPLGHRKSKLRRRELNIGCSEMVD